MKITFFLIFNVCFTVLILISCNNNPVNSTARKVKLLSRIYTNNYLSKQYYYNINLVDSIKCFDSTSRVTTKYVYRYENNKPVSVQTYQYSYRPNNVNEEFYMRLYEFNNLGFVSKMTEYHNNLDSALSYSDYLYDNSNKCIKINWYSNKHALQYYSTYLYKDNEMVSIKYFDYNNFLISSISYTVDDKINCYLHSSPLNIRFNQHNILSVTSSSTIEPNGEIHINYSNGYLVYIAYNSTFEYDSDGYPKVEHKTILSSVPNSVNYYYEYISLN